MIKHSEEFKQEASTILLRRPSEHLDFPDIPSSPNKHDLASVLFKRDAGCRPHVRFIPFWRPNITRNLSEPRR